MKDDSNTYITEHYFVYNPQGQNPKQRHNSKELAKLEAIRLASQFPGQEFHVLASIGYYKVEAPEPKFTPSNNF